MSKVLNLYRLQKLDSHVDKIKKRLVQIDRLLNDNIRVKKTKNALVKAEKNAKTTRIKLKQIEDKVEAKKIKRKLVQNSLFSGKIKNPKDLQDLQKESEAIMRYISQLEDEQLEAMIEHEEADENEKQAINRLNKAKAMTAEENASLLGEQLGLREDFERLLKEREAVIGAVTSGDLNLYDQLRSRKRGIAVAEVTDGGCSICGQALTPSDQQRIRSANQLVFCPSCGRILFES